MKVSGAHHTSYTVSDIERSKAFYCDLLGCELLWEREIVEKYFRDIVAFPDSVVKAAELRIPGTDHMLELFEYSDPRGTPTAKSLRQADHAFVHIGLQSSDVRGDHKDLQSKGVRFISEPVEFRPEVWIVYFYGPDGEVLEMRETPSGDTRS